MYFVFLLISFAHFFLKIGSYPLPIFFFQNEQFSSPVFKIKKGEAKEMSIFLLLPIYWRHAWVSSLLVTSIDC